MSPPSSITRSAMGSSSDKQKAGTKRPRVGAPSACWKPVNVSLDGGDVDGEDDASPHLATAKTKNHYDNEKLAASAANDLPVQPGEDVAMFYGLEVLDGSQYQVVGDGKNKRLKLVEEAATDDVRREVNESTTTDPPPKSKKSKKKKSKSSQPDDVAAPTSSAVINSQDTPESTAPLAEKATGTTITEDQVLQVQQQWSKATGGCMLHARLAQSLARLGFYEPTPIQAATLSASILGRRNLVGAAPTGSGKTLAFVLPILQSVLDQHTSSTTTTTNSKFLRALIITPTRELATQIHAECEKLMPNQAVTLVGGIAQVKQQRLLATKRPPIVVGTPGRLWAMISSAEQDHVKDLSRLQFLVLDEADRLTQDHAFPQLLKLLERIHQANPGDDQDNDDEDDDDESEGDEDDDRLLGLPGIRGEAKLTMLTPEVLEQIQRQRQTTKRPEQRELTEKEYEENMAKENDDGDEQGSYQDFGDGGGDAGEVPPPRVHRQTFIFSATLTLPFTSTKTSSKPKKTKRKIPLEGGLAEILEKAHAMGETKVVDICNGSSSQSSPSSTKHVTNSSKFQLPPGLRLEQIQCTQRHKDSHLYAYLMTTQQGASGPSLVFCNSIAAVRRVGTTLQTLGLSVRILHAHLQQRARFKAVESLHAQSRAVVVCTDVAARGLDIPSVANVIHFDVARAVDTFVHRAGRTARGMGHGAVGTSLSLISPAEDKAQAKIVQALQARFGKVLLDGRLLKSAQERVNLASKVVAASEKEHKAHSSQQWFLEQAKQAELELDEDLLQAEENADDENERRQAQLARVRLAQLLAQPMTTQRYGKFLSTNSAAMQDKINAWAVMPTTNSSGIKNKKRKGHQSTSL